MPASAIPATGLRKLLLIRAAFPDEPSNPLADSEAQQLVSSVSSWYSLHSYRSLSITSDVTPLVILPQTKTWYSQQPPAQLLADARARAFAIGFNTAGYELDAVRHAAISGWNFLGLSVTGSKGIWLQNSGAGVLIHEMGHSFGLEHANAWSAVDDSIIGPGAIINYGDPFDIMAIPQPDPFPGHFNVIWKRRLNWLPSDSIFQATNSGVVRLFAYDVPTLAAQTIYGIRIRKDDLQEYWLEFRQTLTDNRWSGSGILVHWNATPDGTSGAYLLDCTPGTPSGSNGFEDAFLQVGQTLSDFREGIHITPLSTGVTGNGRWIDVKMNMGSFAGNSAPLLAIAADRTNAVPGQDVILTATAGDAEGDPLVYRWDFADQTAGTNSATTRKSWTSPGNYVVRCTVSDMKGGTGMRSLAVTVGAPATFSVRGRITDSAGNGIGRVRIHNGLFGSEYRGALSDSDGTYVLSDLALGAYQLFAIHYGFRFAASGWNLPLTIAGDTTGVNWLGTGNPGVEVYSLDDIAVEASPVAVGGQFLVQRRGPTNFNLPITLRFTGSASFGTDYATEPSVGPRFTLVFPPGMSSTNIGVKPVLDSISESPEDIQLVVVEDQNYVAGPPHRATVRIYDPPAGSNSPPNASRDVINRYLPSYVAVEAGILLSNDTDPDGDLLMLESVAATSLRGATVLKVGTTVYYVPQADLTNDDSFTYVVTDGRGLSGTGTVDVVTATVPPPSLSIAVTNGVRFLTGTGGIPGLGYRLEYKDSIPNGSWQALAGVTNNALGRFIYLESAPAPFLRIFRIAFP